MVDRGVVALCKKCGKKVPSTEFVLDPVYKLMVCRNCSRDRMAKDTPEARKKLEEARNRPAGWDSEDEAVSKSYKPKKPEFSGLQRISEDKVKVRCKRCGTGFTFNTVKRYPLNCPNCGTRTGV